MWRPNNVTKIEIDSQAREIDLFSIALMSTIVSNLCFLARPTSVVYFRVFVIVSFCTLVSILQTARISLTKSTRKFMRKTDVLLSYLLCPYGFELIVYVHTNKNKKNLVVNIHSMGGMWQRTQNPPITNKSSMNNFVNLSNINKWILKRKNKAQPKQWIKSTDDTFKTKKLYKNVIKLFQ